MSPRESSATSTHDAAGSRGRRLLRLARHGHEGDRGDRTRFGRAVGPFQDDFQFLIVRADGNHETPGVGELVEELLIDAAKKAELGDPFVHVTDLGDFSITYRVAGLLAEVKRLISARSKLRTCVLDALHEAGIEVHTVGYGREDAEDLGRRILERATARRTRDRCGSPSAASSASCTAATWSTGTWISSHRGRTWATR